MNQNETLASDADLDRLLSRLGARPLVLVGMMGAGKTTVGRRLAKRLKRRFIDSDAEIEKAAGMSVEDMFKTHGEAEFRAGEARVIARLLAEPDLVLATGGGAFMNEATRVAIGASGISIFISADLDLLFARVSRRSNRPLLKTADPKGTLARLIEQRYPVYALADIVVQSREAPHEAIAADAIDALAQFLDSSDQTAKAPQ